MGGTARESTSAEVSVERLEQLEDRAFELSDREEHYRQLAEAAAARDRAEAQSQAKSHLLATASHEVRTPLSGILGLTDLLLDSGLTAEQESFARAMRSSGELMLRLLDDMLDLAKLEAGRFDLDLHPAELEPRLQDIVELLASRAHGKNLDLAAYVAPGARRPVQVDLPRLRQVLINLLANAIKFTERGSVLVSAERANGWVHFAVEDTGPGVAPADADRIFGPLERAIGVGRSQGAEGSGLGLAISRQIIGAMGSELHLEPRPGGGSVFSFAIQALPASEDAGPASLPQVRRNLLVVAPPGAEAEAICRHLGDEGAAIRSSASVALAAGLAAAAAAAGEGYDAVLIDARTGPDPAAALKAIRAAAGARLPAAVLVTPGKRRGIEEMRAAGYDAYLVRPVRRLSLLRIIERLLESGGGFEEDPGERRPPEAVPPAAGGGLRVLLAEDDEINALLLRSLLRRFGHDVIEVGDGQAAVAAAADPTLDLVLMDMHMPKQDGLAAARAIRAAEAAGRRARRRLVAISADPRPLMRDQALAAGFDMFLPKPIDPDALREVLDEGRGAEPRPAGGD